MRTRADEHVTAISCCQRRGRKNRRRKNRGEKRAGAKKKKKIEGSESIIRHQVFLSNHFPKGKKPDYLIGGIKFSHAPCRLKPTSLKLPANKHQTQGSINEADVLISHLWAAKQLTAAPPSPHSSLPFLLSFSDSTINDLKCPTGSNRPHWESWNTAICIEDLDITEEKGKEWNLEDSSEALDQAQASQGRLLLWNNKWQPRD